jgi:hypothetical protein
MRREHNDAAFIAGDHFRREGANGIRRAIQVVVDHVTPVGVFHLQQRLPPLNRGIGDHDIDFAELLLDLIGRCAKRRNVADVAGAPLASAARSLESVSPSRPIPLASQELGINGLLGAAFFKLEWEDRKEQNYARPGSLFVGRSAMSDQIVRVPGYACAYCGEPLSFSSNGIKAWRVRERFVCNEFCADGISADGETPGNAFLPPRPEIR